jgi:DNA-binding transcriptional LysR family regulator
MDRLDQMEAFIRVVDAGSFTAAARQWGRSKAVVSKYVNALEDHLGVELLRRTTRSLSLTEAGRNYRKRCADVLGEIESLEASVREDIAAPRGPLRVTAPPGLASHYLDVMTNAFLTRYPNVTLDLDLTHRMVNLIEENIDIAIRVTDPRDSSLVARRIAPAPILAVASPDYLRRRGTPEKPADLRDHDCIVDTNFRDQQRWRFRSRRSGGKAETVSVDGPLRINHPDAVREMAEAGLGVALVPDFVAHEALEAGRLCEVLRGRVAFQWSILALYPRRKYLPVRVRAYVEHLLAHMGTSTAPP